MATTTFATNLRDDASVFALDNHLRKLQTTYGESLSICGVKYEHSNLNTHYRPWLTNLPETALIPVTIGGECFYLFFNVNQVAPNAIRTLRCLANLDISKPLLVFDGNDSLGELERNLPLVEYTMQLYLLSLFEIVALIGYDSRRLKRAMKRHLIYIDWVGSKTKTLSELYKYNLQGWKEDERKRAEERFDPLAKLKSAANTSPRLAAIFETETAFCLPINDLVDFSRLPVTFTIGSHPETANIFKRSSILLHSSLRVEPYTHPDNPCINFSTNYITTHDAQRRSSRKASTTAVVSGKQSLSQEVRDYEYIAINLFIGKDVKLHCFTHLAALSSECKKHLEIICNWNNLDDVISEIMTEVTIWIQNNRGNIKYHPRLLAKTLVLCKMLVS